MYIPVKSKTVNEWILEQKWINDIRDFSWKPVCVDMMKYRQLFAIFLFSRLVNMDERVSIKNRLQYIFILLTDASRNKILHRFTGVSLQDAYPWSRISWRCMSAKRACLEDTSAALGFSTGVIYKFWFSFYLGNMISERKFQHAEIS